MQRAEEERPAQERRTGCAHLQHMAQYSMALPVLDFKAMRSVEATRRGETKEDRPRGAVFLNGITDRSVPANSADCQRPVEAHRRPFARRPQAIVAACQRINQRSHSGLGQGELALVNVANLHEFRISERL